MNEQNRLFREMKKLSFSKNEQTKNRTNFCPFWFEENTKTTIRQSKFNSSKFSKYLEELGPD